MNFNMNQRGRFIDGVSVVLTSCQRHDLLERTLDSFIAFNTFKIHELILVEDGPSPPHFLREYDFPFPLRVICTGQRVGQIAAIDYAYSHVRTEHIFHMEDDWEFFRPQFIEKSLIVLSENEKCLQVWLRALSDTNGHTTEKELLSTDGILWRKLDYNFDGMWHGFSFNPGLRRIKDYVDLDGFGIHTLGLPEWSDESGSRETKISQLYKERGMFAAILADGNGKGYVRHLGWNRSLTDQAIDRRRKQI